LALFVEQNPAGLCGFTPGAHLIIERNRNYPIGIGIAFAVQKKFIPLPNRRKNYAFPPTARRSSFVSIHLSSRDCVRSVAVNLRHVAGHQRQQFEYDWQQE
jgi:hypothetical protein